MTDCFIKFYLKKNLFYSTTWKTSRYSTGVGSAIIGKKYPIAYKWIRKCVRQWSWYKHCFSLKYIFKKDIPRKN
ncbi:hypothetical protein BpHYR1_032571 [Brachionus plicatilis]|uniref:Uncharacterized protein n=1 Tax=Brachionus plicatilis TaxID=10195 RepID=A0A3M7RB77_BRAPC|nr:hypothetical protein BpHYR1_032571 [Brachionus plicatilis]